MNINPSLIMGMAMNHAENKKNLNITDRDLKYAELRVYPNNGSGCWFVQSHAAGRWYYKEDADADHFSQVDLAEIEAAITEGARVQLVGYRHLINYALNAWS